MAALTQATPIIEAVDRIEQTFSLRADRQDTDYDRWWKSGLFDVNKDVDGTDLGTDFRSFTGNDSQTFARKVIAIMSAAKVIFQVPYGTAKEGSRQSYDFKERFIVGSLASADERGLLGVHMDIQDALSAYIPIRGWGAARVLLKNMSDGTAIPDIRVWDPRYTFWKVGPRGLEWACYKTERTMADVKAEYRVLSMTHSDEDLVEVYDFYDSTHNVVVMEDKILKKRTPHGFNRVPVAIAAVGPAPRFWNESVQQTEADYGESIFASDRNIWERVNEIWSYWLELTSRAANGNYVYKSDAEDVDDEMDSPGSESGLTTQIGTDEELAPLQNAETTKDTAILAQMAQGQMQRGALPFTSFGELQFQLSGFAITQLNQQMMTVLGPQLKCMRSMYLQIANLLCDQFVTNRFNPLSLRGFANNRDYFQEDFTPEQLFNLPPPLVKIVAQLPQDDVTRMSLAQQGRAPGADGVTPLLPDEFIWENYLDLPDTRLVDRQIKEQQSERASPGAAAFSLMKANAEQGNEPLRMLYELELQSAIVSKQVEMLQLQLTLAQLGQIAGGVPGGPDGAGGGGAPGRASGGRSQRPPGINSQAAPSIALTGQPAGLPQPPQQLTPGTPRPSRRSANG